MNRIKPTSRRLLSVEVVRTERLSPSFLLLTVGGEDLAEFIPLGGDQAFRLLFRRPGQDRLWMPSMSASGLMQYLLAGKERRPLMRFYTVRAFRPAERELDILFALHGGGPASDWAQSARPGEPAGVLDEGAIYAPGAGVNWQLLVGDESALPAVLAILDSDKRGLPSEVFLEVPSTADIQQLRTAPNVRVHWLPRDGRREVPGRYILGAAMASDLPPGRFATFVAGESELPAALQRHLIEQRGAAKSDISIVGYWRHGKASPG